jgi:hypothetical protein
LQKLLTSSERGRTNGGYLVEVHERESWQLVIGLFMNYLYVFVVELETADTPKAMNIRIENHTYLMGAVLPNTLSCFPRLSELHQSSAGAIIKKQNTANDVLDQHVWMLNQNMVARTSRTWRITSCGYLPL